jgi:adenylate cyclase
MAMGTPKVIERATNEAFPPSLAERVAGRLREARVLVVEDDPDVQRSLRGILRKCGAEVHPAVSLGEAIALLHTLRPEAILLDLGLPDGDGTDLIPVVRAVPELAQVPILVLTGREGDDAQVAVLEAGADDFLQKPFHRRILMARLTNLVGRFRAERHAAHLAAELERYVAPPLLHARGRSPVPERLEATILFSDLRGFVASAAQHNLETVFSAIDTLLARQAEVVRHWGGYVDKFAGDGMLAVFADERRSWQACRAAMEIRAWAQHAREIRLWDPPPIGIGIHVGPVLRGNLGSESRREFTVLGGTVNIAARLCGLAGPLEIIVSEGVVRDLPSDLGGVPVGPGEGLAVKGLVELVRVHRLRPEAPPTEGGLPSRSG